LLGQVTAGLGAGPQTTPLDGVLTGPLAERGTGAVVGFRVSRSLSPRFAIEFNFDYSSAPLEMDTDAAAAIEASRAAFVTAWNGVVDSGPFGDATVGATQVISTREGHQTFATGTLNINLRTEGAFIPYLALGGGVRSSIADTPGATLEGSYAFEVSSAWRARETDRVTVRHDAGGHGVVGVVGGGVKLMASRRWGIRIDARLHLGDAVGRTVLDADPDVLTATLAGQVSSITSPSLQLSNNPSSGFPSSLSGPEVTEFTTFGLDGFRSQISLSGGLLWRF
jgi:hypothetical protein